MADVAEMLDMTVSGARQHLSGLADAGLLEVGEAARRPGPAGPQRAGVLHRPGRRAAVPAAYGELTNQLLGYVPAGAVTAAFEHRRDDRIEAARARLAAAGELRGQGRRAGEDPRRGRLPGVRRAARRRRVPHRRAQLRHLRRRPRAPPGLLDRAGVPPRRLPRGDDRAGHPHDGRRPLLQLRGPPPLTQSESCCRASACCWTPLRTPTLDSDGSAPLVVGGLVGDRDVVGVALLAAGRGDPHEAGAGAQRLERRRPGVAHPAAQPADELVDDVAERPGVGDAALDALRARACASPRRRRCRPSSVRWPLA